MSDPFTHGIDIFSGDDPIDAHRIHDVGKQSFVIVKATGGTGYTNPNFIRDLAALKDAGEIDGTYHYAHELGSQGSGLDEWKHFAAQMSRIGGITGLLPGSYDLEASGLTYRDVRNWVAMHRDTWNAWPILYGSPYFLDDLLQGDDFFLPCMPWIAHYYFDSRGPLLSRPWGNMTRTNAIWTPANPHGWAFWQHSDKGSVPGVNAAAVDLDVFNGDFATLRSRVVGAPTPQKPLVWTEVADVQRSIVQVSTDASGNGRASLGKVEPIAVVPNVSARNFWPVTTGIDIRDDGTLELVLTGAPANAKISCWVTVE